ncbi:MAG: cyclophilin-like fold protein [Coprobacillus sp.]
MHSRIKVIVILVIIMTLLGCQSQNNKLHKKTSTIKEEVSENMNDTYIEMNSYLYEIELYDNQTSKELFKLFPLVLSMDDMNGNEKYCYMNKALPTLSQKVNEIKAGDVMLFGDNCLVIFYKDFSTQYSYTKIGHIKDVNEFLKALPKGQVEVTFHNDET